jgi:hypothetical protein
MNTSACCLKKPAKSALRALTGLLLAMAGARAQAAEPTPSRDKPAEAFATLLANCRLHGRRQFVEITENFPRNAARSWGACAKSIGSTPSRAGSTWVVITLVELSASFESAPANASITSAPRHARMTRPLQLGRWASAKNCQSVSRMSLVTGANQERLEQVTYTFPKGQ